MTTETDPGRQVAIRQAPTGDLVPQGYEPLDFEPPPVAKMPTEAEYNMMAMIASTAVEGGNGLVPASIKNAKNAMAVMIAAYEYAIPPMTALRRFYVVNGKVEMETQAMMGIVKAGARRDGKEARFIFHEYTNEAADVELTIDGESIIRCRYTQEDAMNAHQGFRKRVQSWNGNRPNYAKVNNQYVWDPDEDSYWHKWPRDAVTYNAVKRLCRLGAPEYINGIGGGTPDSRYRITSPDPQQNLAPGDVDGTPNPMTKALLDGELKPSELADAPDAPPDDVNTDPPAAADDEGEPVQDGEFADIPPPEVQTEGVDVPAPETPAQAPSTVETAADAPQEEEPPPAASAGAITGKTKQAIAKVLTELQQTTGTRYPVFYRELCQRFFAGAPKDSKFGMLLAACTEAQGQEILVACRKERGDPDLQDPPPSTEAPAGQ